MPSPAFWGNEADILIKLLFPFLSDTVVDASLGALKQIGIQYREVDIGIDWDLYDEKIQGLAKNYAFAMIRGITGNSANMVQGAISKWIASGDPLDILIETLMPIFGPTRASAIAITEVTRIFALGNLEAWRASGVVDAIAWMTAEDDLVCPICEPLGVMEPQPIDNPNFDGRKHPPAHTRCRCWLRPIVSVAKFLKRIGRRPPERLLRVA